MNLESFVKLQKQVEGLQRQADEAAGALKQLMKQLKKEFACNSLQEANRLLEELRQQEVTAQVEFATELKVFKKQWGHLLNGQSD